MMSRYTRLPPALAAAALVALVVVSARVADGSAPPHPIESHIRDPEFEETLSRSFETILTEEERAEYLSRDLVGRREMRARFWTANDPTPGSAENEFLNEHLRRLAYVLDNLCPLEHARWDARGEVALRFGLPSARCEVHERFGLVYGSMGLVPPAEVWQYAEVNAAFHFVDANLDGCYDLGEDSKERMARPRPTPVWDGQLEGPSTPGPVRTDMEGELYARNAARQRDRGLSALDEVAVAYEHRTQEPPLDLFYEVVLARGPSGDCDVAVNYEIDASQLSGREDDGSPGTTLRKELRVFNPDFDVVASEARLVEISGAEAGGLVADEWRFTAPPGEYIVGITVSDTASGRTGNGRSRFTAPVYPAGRLSMSDVMVCTSVRDAERFERMGGSVVPHPARFFDRADSLFVYFELYGLVEDTPGRSRFSVTTEISDVARPDRGNWLQRLVSDLLGERAERAIESEVLAPGDVPDTAYWQAVSLENMSEGNYAIAITVRDVVSKEEARGSASFTVLDR